MSESLKKILGEVEKRAAQRPDWARSDYAQREIAQLQVSEPGQAPADLQMRQNTREG